MQKFSKWLWRIATLVFIAILFYQGWLYWQVSRLDTKNPQDTSMMQARLAEMESAGKATRIDYRWVPMKKISRYLQRAIIASEDATFYSHEGFDWEGIKVAAEKNLKKGKIVAGGSTISQQLAKNLFLSTQRTPWRKAEEAVITVMLENSLSKQRIFEIYLNVIEWGDGVFGAEAAARHYFKKSAASLTPREAAWLAAIVPNPRYYDKHRAHRRAARKSNIILARMAVRYGRDFNAAPRVVEAPVTPAPELTLPTEPEPSSDTSMPDNRTLADPATSNNEALPATEMPSPTPPPAAPTPENTLPE